MAGLYFIKSGLDKTWHQQMSRRLAWLRDLGVMGMVHLHPLPDGLLGFHGMPLENAAGCLPSNAGPELVALALRDPRNHPLMGGYITLLRCRDPYTHVAWGEALDRLVALCGATTRASDVSYVLSEAEASYLTDRNQLFRFIHMAKEDYRHVLNQAEPVRAWLAQCMARMFGVQAPSQPDMNWWPRVREHVELGDDETFFSLTDLAWRRLLEAVSHADSGFHEKAEMGAKKVVNLVGKFLQHEKNKLVWELVIESTSLVCQHLNGPKRPSMGGRRRRLRTKCGGTPGTRQGRVKEMVAWQEMCRNGSCFGRSNAAKQRISPHLQLSA